MTRLTASDNYNFIDFIRIVSTGNNISFKY